MDVLGTDTGTGTEQIQFMDSSASLKYNRGELNRRREKWGRFSLWLFQSAIAPLNTENKARPEGSSYIVDSFFAHGGRGVVLKLPAPELEGGELLEVGHDWVLVGRSATFAERKATMPVAMLVLWEELGQECNSA